MRRETLSIVRCYSRHAKLLGSEPGSSGVLTEIAHIKKEVVTVAQKAVAEASAPAVKEGEGGYADWVIVSSHALRQYLDQPYRRVMEIRY